MSFIHHFLRVIWANVIGFFYNLFYFIRIKLEANAYQRYRYNRECWEKIGTLQELICYFRNNYSYKYDGYKGIADHNNFGFEFFTDCGDCDDVARWSCRKLRQLGIKADVYGFADMGASPKFWHYDCILTVSGVTMLFNYGHLNVISDGMQNDAMAEIYGKKYNFKKMKSWKCRYM